MQAIPHGLSNNNIDPSFKIFPKHSLNSTLKFILFDNLSHHIHILYFSFSFSSNDAINFLTSCLCGKNRIEKIDTLTDMQHFFTCEQVLIVHNHLVEGIISYLILNSCLKVVHWKIVNFMHVRRILYPLKWLSNIYFILFLGLYFLLSLSFACLAFWWWGCGHQLWTTVNITIIISITKKELG